VVQVPFAISWPDFLKRLRDEFPGVCGCTYVHNDAVAVISNFRQFEQACERVEDAFIAGNSDGSLDILVCRLFTCLFVLTCIKCFMEWPKYITFKTLSGYRRRNSPC
jgi:hypothetical protein